MVRSVVLVALLGTAAHAQDDAPAAATGVPHCTSITIEPLSAMISTLSVGVERRIKPQVGLTGLAGVGLTSRVSIGDRVHRYAVGPSTEALEDVRYARLHVGAQASWYARQFDGTHVSVEVVYVHHGWAEPQRQSIDSVSASAYAGYKWIHRSGFTLAIQAGLGLVLTHGEDERSDGVILDREGTLGPVHLAANGNVGWTF